MPAQIPTFSRPLRYGGDPDVLRFLSFGVSIGENPLSVSQAAALHRFVIYLKAQNLWDSFDVIWPIVGGTTGWHSLNIVDPTLYRMIQNGTVVNNSNGTQGNGINGYWDSTYPYSTQTDGGFFSFYSRTSNGEDSIRDFGFDGSSMGFNARDTGDNISGVYNGGFVSGFNDNASGFFTLGVDSGGEGAGNSYAMRNAIFKGGDVANYNPENASLTWMCNGVPGGPNDSFSNRQYSFFAAGSNYQFGYEVFFNEAVQFLQSALGRQV